MSSVGMHDQSPEKLRQEQVQEGRKRATLGLREDAPRRSHRPTSKPVGSSATKAKAANRPKRGGQAKSMSAQDRVLADIRKRNGYINLIHGTMPDGGLRGTVGKLVDFDRHCLVVDVQMDVGDRSQMVFYKHALDWFFALSDEAGRQFDKDIVANHAEAARTQQGEQ